MLIKTFFSILPMKLFSGIILFLTNLILLKNLSLGEYTEYSLTILNINFFVVFLDFGLSTYLNIASKDNGELKDKVIFAWHFLIPILILMILINFILILFGFTKNYLIFAISFLTLGTTYFSMIIKSSGRLIFSEFFILFVRPVLLITVIFFLFYLKLVESLLTFWIIYFLIFLFVFILYFISLLKLNFIRFSDFLIFNLAIHIKKFFLIIKEKKNFIFLHIFTFFEEYLPLLILITILPKENFGIISAFSVMVVIFRYLLDIQNGIFISIKNRNKIQDDYLKVNLIALLLSFITLIFFIFFSELIINFLPTEYHDHTYILYSLVFINCISVIFGSPSVILLRNGMVLEVNKIYLKTFIFNFFVFLVAIFYFGIKGFLVGLLLKLIFWNVLMFNELHKRINLYPSYFFLLIIKFLDKYNNLYIKR